MTDGKQRGLSAEEMQAEQAEALPDREAMSVLDGTDLFSGTPLLNLDVNLDAKVSAAAPIDAGVAANANVAAPIDAAVSANALSPNGQSLASAPQQTLIDQTLNGTATAVTDQQSGITQGT